MFNNKYSRTNIILGWLSFVIAFITYFLTKEPTVSWWDCGEFISSAYKLEVGHSPGAPFFMLLANFFSMFASGPEKVAVMINTLSVLTSALTILFLFWSISHLAKKLVIKNENYSVENLIIVFGSAMVGALAYTFSDTFWFSAVEGEVYATSSLFTAVVFWAILKWENVADAKHADRWLILIAYLMGLSIGVHLLNLLAIPAIVMVYYFRRYEVTTKGTWRAFLVSIIILAVVMYGIIQGFVFLASRFELIFVNGFRLPFGSGVIIYSILIVAAIVYGIWYSHKHQKVILNVLILGTAVIILGYFSYATIVIRASVDTPINLNDPDDVFSLHSYLNRESYGDRPLLTGHYYSDEIKRNRMGYPDIKEGAAVYVKDTVHNKYRVAFRKSELQYEGGAKLFPRIYSRNQQHIKAYKNWAGIKDGQKPGLGNNIRFFLSYQMGHMYFRYFMWNFAGRQNDTQSHGSLVNGNWISGINFIDEIRLGDQELLPDKYKNQKSRNKYYLLPLIFGMVGLLYQYSLSKRSFMVTFLLFFFTGIAIVIYLNQTPFQPRERDYAYAGSFYAYAIWIGLGVAGLYDALKKYGKGSVVAVLLVLISLLIVPGIMAKENYDDHDRSDRYTAREFAKNYLRSCDENAILFTGGDNDTYPVWYVQEVEGFRTDVRVVNTMLLNSEWNIAQIRKKAYDSDPLPLSLSEKHYAKGENNSFYVQKDERGRKINLKTIVQGVEMENRMFRQKTASGDAVTVIPSNVFVLNVDSSTVVNNGTVKPENADQVVNEVEWRVRDGQMYKGNLAQLDLLANFDWKRPIYFVTGGNEGSLSLEDYFQFEGQAYRLVPIRTPNRNFFSYGRIDTEKLYDNLMNKFEWGGLGEEDVYIDYYNIRSTGVIKIRRNFVRLANKLLDEGDSVRAIKVLDKCMKLLPNWQVPYDHYISGLNYPVGKDRTQRVEGVIETYYRAGAIDKGNALLLEFANILKQDLLYYESLKERFKPRFAEEAGQSQGLLQECFMIARVYGHEDILNELYQ